MWCWKPSLFPDFRMVQRGPQISSRTTNETGGLKAGGRIGCDFLTIRTSARASCDGKQAPPKRGLRVLLSLQSLCGGWTGAQNHLPLSGLSQGHCGSAQQQHTSGKKLALPCCGCLPFPDCISSSWDTLLPTFPTQWIKIIPKLGN